MKIAVTGPKGRLASWLIKYHGCVPIEADITDESSLRIEIQRIEPDVVINAAAYTKVDQAEIEKERALLVNLRGAGNVRMAHSGYLVHVSTSYIFSGSKDQPYVEEDEPAPLSHYGWSKWGGEASVSVRPENTLIVRTVSLYGPGPHDDFVKQVRRLLESEKEFSIPSNLFSNPTYVPHLAEAIMAAVSKGITGVLNIAGTTRVSRAKWAREIAKMFRLDSKLVLDSWYVPEEGKAARPREASLDLSKAKSLRLPLYPLSRGLRDLRHGQT